MQTTTETRTATSRPHYERIAARAVPEGLRWDVPGRHQGQVIEVAYADAHPGASPADTARDARMASDYRRTTDRSDGAVTYSRLLSETERSVIEAVEDGVRTLEDLARHTGESYAATKGAVGRLCRDGVLHSTGFPAPTYRVVPAEHR